MESKPDHMEDKVNLPIVTLKDILTRGHITTYPNEQVWLPDYPAWPDLKFHKNDPRAKMPARALDSNGYDLNCVEGGEVKQGEVTKFDTGISMDLTGYALLILPKSGLAVKHGIHVMAGLCDSNFTGSIQVCLTKLTPGTHIFRDGDKIAQFILLHTPTPNLVEVNELPETVRGSNGFGSTGN